MSSGLVPAARDEGGNNRWCNIKKCLAIGGCFATVTVVLEIVPLVLSAVSISCISNISQTIGNKQCPDVPGTSLIYYGFTAGFQTATGATTFSCLPLTV